MAPFHLSPPPAPPPPPTYISFPLAAPFLAIPHCPLSSNSLAAPDSSVVVMQAKVSEQWGLRPKQEGARVLSDLHLLQRDYQLLTMVHGEAVKQVPCLCLHINNHKIDKERRHKSFQQ